VDLLALSMNHVGAGVLEGYKRAVPDAREPAGIWPLDELFSVRGERAGSCKKPPR